MEAAPRFELGVKVLQTSALPLGYAAAKTHSSAFILKNMLIIKHHKNNKARNNVIDSGGNQKLITKNLQPSSAKSYQNPSKR